jgi:magnesium chelatase family protein
VWSVALTGLAGKLVEIEADMGGGLPGVTLVGLPDAGLREAKERVRSAIRNSGQSWPQEKVTLGLSPADLPKLGSGYDLAIALSVLAAAGRIPTTELGDTVVLGELALDGRIRGIKGVLPSLLVARKSGLKRAVVPQESLFEAALVEDMEIFGAICLRDVLLWLEGEDVLLRPEIPIVAGGIVPSGQANPELSDVLGQPEARWALEIAAAGGHHLLFSGPPGIGKTMLAKRLPSLLPTLSGDQALEVTALHSLQGTLSRSEPLIKIPPFVAPHHTISVAALIGGGSGLATPGLISQAHHGVLFLDEVCEFGSQRLESLRTVLEEGEVRISRQKGTVRYPARFQLVLATNPCPCAPARERDCSCSPAARRRYLGRLSGPLLDRIDIRVRMRPITAMSMCEATIPESTETVRLRVSTARERAIERWAGRGWRTNAQVPGTVLRREFALPPKATSLLDKSLERGLLTARGADRCLRLAWTLSDLDGSTSPGADHVATALEFRDRTAA